MAALEILASVCHSPGWDTRLLQGMSSDGVATFQFLDRLKLPITFIEKLINLFIVLPILKYRNLSDFL
jgi:hypothetical protein